MNDCEPDAVGLAHAQRDLGTDRSFSQRTYRPAVATLLTQRSALRAIAAHTTPCYHPRRLVASVLRREYLYYES
jgi:hypothetical protein